MKILSVSLLTSMFATGCKSLSKGIGKALHQTTMNLSMILVVARSTSNMAQLLIAQSVDVNAISRDPDILSDGLSIVDLGSAE